MVGFLKTPESIAAILKHLDNPNGIYGPGGASGFRHEPFPSYRCFHMFL